MAVFCCSYDKNWVSLALTFGGLMPPPQKVEGAYPSDFGKERIRTCLE